MARGPRLRLDKAKVTVRGAAGQGHVQGRARPCPRTGHCVGDWTGPKTKAVATCQGPFVNLRIDIAKETRARAMSSRTGPCPWTCTFPFVNLRIDIPCQVQGRAFLDRRRLFLPN